MQIQEALRHCKDLPLAGLRPNEDCLQCAPSSLDATESDARRLKAEDTLAHLEEVKLPPGAAGANQEVLGEEEALALPLLLQRQRAQSDLAELPALHRRQLDERACGAIMGNKKGLQYVSWR